MAVRVRARDQFGADDAAAAAAVVDDRRLAPRFGQLQPDQARLHVAGSARRIRHNDANRLGRINLAKRWQRTHRECARNAAIRGAPAQAFALQDHTLRCCKINCSVSCAQRSASVAATWYESPGITRSSEFGISFCHSSVDSIEPNALASVVITSVG